MYTYAIHIRESIYFHEHLLNYLFNWEKVRSKEFDILCRLAFDTESYLKLRAKWRQFQKSNCLMFLYKENRGDEEREREPFYTLYQMYVLCFTKTKG